MEWKTHFLSGALVGYVAAPTIETVLIGAVAAVLADLDEPRSKFGKLFFFISYPINAYFEHRTITHSLPFVLLITCLLYPLMNQEYVLAFSLGYIVHIIGDMLTGKVQLLYPYKRTFGIGIPHIAYILIDRITRYTLVVVALYLIYLEGKSYIVGGII